jgi:hypothetical protein
MDFIRLIFRGIKAVSCICAQTRTFLTFRATHGKRKLALLDRMAEVGLLAPDARVES